MDSDNLKVRASALRLADSIKGTSATREWLKFAAKKPDPIIGAEIIEMLARRADKYALSAITKYIEAEDKALELMVRVNLLAPMQLTRDLLPTLAAAAGLEPGNTKPLDGENIWPAIRDGKVVELREYRTKAEALEATGLSE